MRGDIPIAEMEALIDTARGEAEADLVLINGQVVNVFSGEIQSLNVVIKGRRIAGLGDYRQGHRVLDLNGRYIIPGLIDSHIHIESSLLTPAAFAAAAVPHGTTAIIADPHEIVNVGGLAAWEYMVKAARNLPLDIFYNVPSCVPATHMETAGASFGLAEITRAFEIFPESPGLAELMNYPGVLYKNPTVLQMIRQTLGDGRRIDGHAPALELNDLNAYLSTGISSDHECTCQEDALEKLRRGMQVLIREGSCAKSLSELLPLVNDFNMSSFSFCCDDRHAGDLLEEGEIDAILRQAVHLGMPPVQAVRIASLNTARHYGLFDRGAVAPGYLADLVVVDDLTNFTVRQVIKNGQVVADNGSLMVTLREESEPAILNSVHIPDITGKLVPEKPNWAKKARVIEVMAEQVLTGALLIPADELDKYNLSNLAVIERHGKNGGIGHGLVKGLGLERGALASTVGHDSHNLIVAGRDEASMELAVSTVADMGGGLAVVAEGQVLASLALPVGGLMSPNPAAEVAAAYEKIEAAAHSIGCTLPAPFMTLSFLPLAVIPAIRLTDHGLVDVNEFQLVDLWLP
ncbi:MAG: adenine deaminase [Candidatus Saccharibacteria bacterium]